MYFECTLKVLCLFLQSSFVGPLLQTASMKNHFSITFSVTLGGWLTLQNLLTVLRTAIVESYEHWGEKFVLSQKCFFLQ